jgi:hypothetical protein
MDSCKPKIAPQIDPDAPQIGNRRRRNPLLFVRAIRMIPRELLYGFVICENVAMDTAKQRNRYFKYWHEQVFRGLTNWSVIHTLTRINISRANPLKKPVKKSGRIPRLFAMPGEEEDQIGLRDDVVAARLFNENGRGLRTHALSHFGE